jgi:hypothetical protein
MGEEKMGTFMLQLEEEDKSIDSMCKSLGTEKNNIIILSLNLLNLVLEKRRNGEFLAWSKDKDNTTAILSEATDGSVPFKLNQK